MHEKLYVLHALSPLHAGTGRGQDLIDLPIAREAATGHPYLPGSSLKGVLRERVRSEEAAASGVEPGTRSVTWKLFGPDTNHAAEHPGSVRFSDARLVLLPVRSDRGTFAWVTCPLVLARLRRDAGALTGFPATAVPTVKAESARLATSSVLAEGGQVHLGVMTLACGDALPADWVEAISALVFAGDAWWTTALAERLCLVDDDMFTWLAETTTEVRARIRIDPDKGTVAKGALWYEESLPAESILAGLVRGASTAARPEPAEGEVEGDEAPRSTPVISAGDALTALTPYLTAPLQLGGNATVGMGLTQLHLRGGAR
jgi:CRISPR-associated protein Cmr4